MTGSNAPIWQQKLKAAIRRDPKKAGVLGFLMLVLVGMVGRMGVNGKSAPPASTAGPIGTSHVAPAPDALRPPQRKSENSALAMRHWLSASVPKLQRNLFVVPMDYYTRPSTKIGLRPAKSENPAPDDKSAQIAADEEKERQTLIGNLELDARQLKLQTTLMSKHPTALINGQMLKEGDSISPGEGLEPFKVVKIQPRSVIIERENIKLELLMN